MASVAGPFFLGQDPPGSETGVKALRIPIPLIEKMKPRTACLVSATDFDVPDLGEAAIEKFPDIESAGQQKFDLVAFSDHVDVTELSGFLTSCEAITNGAGTIAAHIDYARGPSCAYEELPSLLASLHPKYVFRVVGSGPDCRAFPALTLIRRRDPSVLLFIGPSMQGKTSIAAFLGQFLPAVHGDNHLLQLSAGTIETPPRLKSVLERMKNGGDWSTIISAIFADGLSKDLLESMPLVKSKADFIFDMWVPDSCHELLATQFEELGYRPFLAGRNAYPPSFPEYSYLRRHADVAAAVLRGQFPNGWLHYESHGRVEGRSF